MVVNSMDLYMQTPATNQLGETAGYFSFFTSAGDIFKTIEDWCTTRTKTRGFSRRLLLLG